MKGLTNIRNNKDIHVFHNEQKPKGEGSFALFKDRTISLLERWERFAKQHDGEDKRCIRGFLQEVNDDYTKYLYEEYPDPRD